MRIGEQYWTAYIHPKTLWRQVLRTTYKDDMADRLRVREGRVFDSVKQANDWVETRLLGGVQEV
jgi:hypothetical protein